MYVYKYRTTYRYLNVDFKRKLISELRLSVWKCCFQYWEEAVIVSTVEINEYFLLMVLHCLMSYILKEKMFTWAIEEVLESDSAHIITAVCLFEIEESVVNDNCTFPLRAGVQISKYVADCLSECMFY